jgi:RHS repeat-associated protein
MSGIASTRRKQGKLFGSFFAASLIIAGLYSLGNRLLEAADTVPGDFRLTPVAITLSAGDGDDPGALIDRSTNTRFTSSADAELTVSLGEQREVSAVKLFGPSPYLLTVKAERSGMWETLSGLERLDLRNLTDTWHRFEATSALTTDKLLFVFSARKSKKAEGLKEIEIWGKARGTSSKSARDLLALVHGPLAPDQAKLYTATPAQVELGGKGGSAEGRFTVTLDREPQSVRRAWLVYESTGAGHWVSATRSINGGKALGGDFFFSSSAWSSQLEPINPSQLVRGNNTITFAQSGEGAAYGIRNLQLFVELDNGANFIERIEAQPNSDANPAFLAVDGDGNSGWSPYPSGEADTADPSLTLHFDKPTALEAINLSLRNTLGGKIEVEQLTDGEWRRTTAGPFLGSKLGAGENRLEMTGLGKADGVRLVFTKGAGSSAEITEVQPLGSGEGYSWGPAISIGYPLDGEFYGDSAYVRAFVQPLDNGSGPAAVTVAGIVVEASDGNIEALVSKEQAGFGSSAESAPWSFDIEAIYPDGQRLVRTVQLYNQGDSAQVSAPSASSRSSAAAAAVVPDLSGSPFLLAHDEGELDLDGDSMDESPSTLTITSLAHRDLPPLDPGMTNVTKGPRKGYRFGPHGKKFKKNIKVKLPYDKSKLPEGMSEADIRTYYFDEETGHWRALERVNVDDQKKEIVSHTNHFTDMINATLVLPEHPEAANFNPTQIKDIKAADPGAGINLIEPPQANNMGDARLSYPIEIPPGRAGMQPQLAIQYNSGGGNGWLGLGWDLSVPTITVETRWGVPRYLSDKESETYLLNGEMLSPTAHHDEFVDRVSNREYQPRIEGQFRKITRHGDNPKNYWWEVVDKSGNSFFYGATQANPTVVPQSTVLTDDAGNIFRWQLLEQRDAHGNTIKYQYSHVEHSGNGGGVGRQLYLGKILYTGFAGTDGPYTIELLRDRQLGEPDRKDIVIDGRGGFKQVTADLLQRIEVKYNGDLVRAYGLSYEEGVFAKTRLNALTQYKPDGTTQFNQHRFTYYDDLDSAGTPGKIDGIEQNVTQWSVPSDSVRGDLIAGSEPVSMLSGSESTSSGGNLYLGISWPGPSKSTSGGAKGGKTTGGSSTLSMLMDMDGDGLADKVYRNAGGIYYRKNLGGAGSGQTAFSSEVYRVKGISHLGKGKSSTRFGGPSLNYGASVNKSGSSGTNTQSTYFTDVNGDGISDQVNGALVYFGYVDKETEEVRYSINSFDTEVPLSGNREIAGEGLLADRKELERQMIEDNPLIDAVRVWVAPYGGKVDITGTISLIENLGEERKEYEPDGVRVAIQHNQSELWSKLIEGDDYSTHTPDTDSLKGRSVSKGDRLYFRVGSIDDGAYDQVKWAPEIRYLHSAEADEEDVNGLPIYRYSASDDFVVIGRMGQMVASYAGTIELSGKLEKSAPTSDRITIELRAVKLGPNGEMDNYTIPYSHTLEGSETATVDLLGAGELSVDKNDFLFLTLKSDSEIDLKAVSWLEAPMFRYLSAYRETQQVTDDTTDNQDDPDAEVIVTIPAGEVDVSQVEPLRLYYNAESYNANSLSAPYRAWVAPESGEVLVRPQVNPPMLPGYSPLDDDPEYGYMANGEFNFTVKAKQSLLVKQKESVIENTSFQFNPNGVLAMLEENEKYYFGFSTRSRYIGSSTGTRHKATLHYLNHASDREIDEVPVYSTVPTNNTFFTGQPVADGTVVKFKPVIKAGQEELAATITAIYVIQTFPDSQTSKVHTIALSDDNRNEYQHLVFDDASSLRFYYLSEAVQGGETLGLSLKFYSMSEGGIVPTQLNWTRDSQLYGDMYRNWGYIAYNSNGDRGTRAIDENLLKFPSGGKDADLSQMKFIPAVPLQDEGGATSSDTQLPIGSDRWVVGDELWWILPDRMSASRDGLDRIHVPSDAQYAGASAVLKQSVSNGDTVGAGGLNVNLSIGDTASSTLVDYMDLNGDRFPDVVSEQGVLYTGPRGGYQGAFVASPFAIGDSSTGVNSISAGGSMLPSSASNTKGGAEPTLGITLAYNQSTTTQQTSYIDMNGDGLSDRVRATAQGIKVRLNYGYGFSEQEMNWGSGAISRSKVTSIPPPINPGWASGPLEFGGGFSMDDQRPATLESLMDLNGDGLVDAVSYNAGKVYVAFNSGVRFLPAVEWASGIDSGVTVNRTISHQAGAYATHYIPLCITPVGVVVCWIVVNPGINQSKTVSRQEVQWSDINGDGYPDYLKSTQDDELNVRHSKIGRTNKLQMVERPLGGHFTLDYTQTGNTYAQPQSRWVVSEIEVSDGVDGDGGNHHSRFYYEDGYYSRIERDFYGFARVTAEQLDSDSTVLRSRELNYRTDSYYGKGLLQSELIRDHQEGGTIRVYRKTQNEYQFFDAINQTENADTTALTGSIWPQLARTDRFFYEAGSSNAQHTYTAYYYDNYGNVTGFFDAGDAGAGDDVRADITYSTDDALCRDRHILDKATTIRVYNAANALLRHREGTIDCSNQYNGNMTELRQYLENGVAVHTLDHDQYGSLTSLIGPADDNGAQTSLTIDYDDTVHTYPVMVTNHFGLSLSSSYDYAFGKKLSQTDPNGNTIGYTLDSVGRISTITGPYQQGSGHNTIEFEYHPETAPPHAITRHYDRFRDAGGQDTLDTVLFTDGLKRVLQTKKDNSLYNQNGSITDGMTVSGRVIFDALGRSVEQYQPTFEPKGTAAAFRPAFSGFVTRTGYDVLDRTTRLTLPDGSITTTDYDLANEPGGALRLRTTVTDAEGNKRESYRDVRELITTVREFNGGQAIDTRYGYDPLKQITSVLDAKGNRTTVGYDLLGRRTAIDNPDTGLIEYGYDLTGNLRYKVTPNLRPDGKAIEYLYDRDRLVNIRYPNHPQSNVTYTYGDNTPANANVGRVGRITRVDHQSGYEERWYGKLGETVKETKYVHLPGELWHSGQKHNQGKTQPEEYEVFTTEYEYDTFGRLQNMLYPDGERLTYTYNAGGLPEKVTGSYKRAPYDYVSRIGYDEYEQRVHVALGNGAVTDYRYDTRTRRLNTLQTQSQGYRFQDLGYSYDKVGNILGLKNDIDPPASGMGGYVNQTFTYDGLYRLSTASGTYMGDLDSREHYTLSMQYDTIHNIKRKNQRHWVESLDGNAAKHGTTYDWRYGYNGAQPHAPTNIGELDPVSFNIVGRTFSFDANGNQLGWSSDRNATQRSITWDDENRIQAIDDKGKTSQYSYDDAGQRVIKQARQNLTVYVNQYFTERNGSIGSKHIFVGNSRLLTKVTGGTLFIRSYDGVTGAKTPPGQLKNADKGNDAQGSATAAGGTTPGAANGKALGKEKNADKGNNGKSQASNGKGDAQGRANAAGGTTPGAANASAGDKKAGVNGLEHRSERANEVAQNTCKNKHLRDEYCDEDGNGIPDSQEGGEEGGADGTAPDEVVTIGSNGEQLFYYHSDHLGSTGYVTRENGELHEHIQYFPFGETWVQQGGNTEKSPYLFTSKELDEETGLYYFGARYYDPRTSVWQSADTILGEYLPYRLDKAQLNTNFKPEVHLAGMGGVYDPRNVALYSYVSQNPLIYNDPNGEVKSWPKLARSVVGIIANGVGVGAGVTMQGAGVILIATPEPTMVSVAGGAGLLTLGTATLGFSVDGMKNNVADAMSNILETEIKPTDTLKSDVLGDNPSPTTELVYDGVELATGAVSGRVNSAEGVLGKLGDKIGDLDTAISSGEVMSKSAEIIDESISP